MVPAVVFNSKGQRISGLSQEDFALTSDNKAVKLDFFSAGTDHVALAFLLDASGSAHEYITRQREVALSLFSHFGSGSEVAVLRFTNSVEVGAPFTTDLEEARKGFRFPAFANRRTAIFDSAMTALDMFRKRRGIPTERRIVILTSDGLDTASAAKASQVIARAQQDGVSFYVIHFPLYSPIDGHLQPRPAARGFRDIAEKTGGRYFMVGDAKSSLAPEPSYDLSPVFKAIGEDLAGQYLLGFYPEAEARDGIAHRLGIYLTNKHTKSYRVRTLREEYIVKENND
jgi:VWFA-related protein